MGKIIETNIKREKTINFNTLDFDVKAYFIDLDGTTLDKKIRRTISKKNIDVLKNKNKTIPIVISTGRAYSQKVKKVMELINCKYAICQNGAVIGDNQGNILKEITLNKEQMELIINICLSYNVSFTINGRFEIFTNQKNYYLLKPFLWKKIKKIKKFNFNDYKVNKVVLAGRRKKNINHIYDKIKDLIPDTSIKMSSHDYIIEITHKEATKGNGAVFISNLLQVNPKETVHVGDSQNDTTTIDVVGALIAMKNSSTKLLEVATHVGPSYKNGGVAKIIEGDFKKNK